MTRFKYLKKEEDSGEPVGPAIKLTVKRIKNRDYLYAQARVGGRVRSVCLSEAGKLIDFINALQKRLDCSDEEASLIAVLYLVNGPKKEQMDRAFAGE
jgi:hypothetical protein